MEMRSEEAEETMQQQQQEQVQLPPVLEEKKKKRVMVAIDESEGSFYALKWALANLFTTCDHGLDGLGVDQEDVGVMTIVHVQQPFQHYIFPAGPAVYATTTVIESVKKAQEQNSAMLLSRAVQICKEKPIKVETVVLDGDPKDMICQAAEQTHPDIVVVGSRGLSKLKRAFLGSVSDYCAHHVKCPILIVKPPK